MEPTVMPPPKRTYKRRASIPSTSKESNKLIYLIRRIPNDLEIEEINKFWEEINLNGGYDNLKSLLECASFKKMYSDEELNTIRENLEIYKGCKDISSEQNSTMDESISIDDIQQARAAIYEYGDAVSISLPISLISSDSEFEYSEQPPKLRKTYVSEEAEGKKLYIEFKNVITEKIQNVMKDSEENTTDFDSILEKLKEISSMQEEYLKNESEMLEFSGKLKTLHEKQKAKCSEMLRAISIINNLLSKIETFDVNAIKSRIDNEVLGFGQQQRLEIWKTFLRKQMDSLKKAITNNLNLD